MLDKSAPAVKADAHDHAGRIPSHNDAARAAAPIASSASAPTEPVGPGGGRPGINDSSHLVK